MTAFRSAKQGIPPDDLLEIRYETLRQEPLGTLQKIAEFGASEWSAHFDQTVKRFSLRTVNDKWRRDLNNEQQNALCECL